MHATVRSQCSILCLEHHQQVVGGRIFKAAQENLAVTEGTAQVGKGDAAGAGQSVQRCELFTLQALG